MKKFGVLFSVLLFLIIFSFALHAAPKKCQEWNVMIAPYAWVTWMNGDLTVNRLSSSINYTPEDITNNLDSILMLHAEVSRGKWTLLVDPMYVKLSNNIASALVTIKQTTIDAGVFYNLMNKLFNENSLKGEIYAGGRYWRLKSELSASAISVNGEQNWVDPVIGGRLIYCLMNHWQLAGYGDIGGFGLVSHFTWQIRATATYLFNKHLGLSAGFKALYVNYANQKNTGNFKYSVTSYGPLLGIVFTF